MKIGSYELPTGEFCGDCKMKRKYENDGTEISYCWLWEQRLDYIKAGYGTFTKLVKCNDYSDYCNKEKDLSAATE